MNCLLLFAPQWIPFNPHLAGPAIQAALQGAGHQVRLRDLNAEFYQRILTPEFLYEAVKGAFDDFELHAAEVFGQCPHEPDLKDHPPAFQSRYRRYREIRRMADRNEYKPVIMQLAAATAVLRDTDAFYDPSRAHEALTTIVKACEILSAVYHPSLVYFLAPSVKIYYTVETLKTDCENCDGNIWYRFFQDLMPSLLEENPDFIGISLGDYSQLLPGLTLAMLLKRSTKAHVCIGGNLFGRYTDVLVNNPEFFQVFADSVIYNEGERPVVELTRQLAGNTSLQAVPNLIYLGADGRIAITDEAPPYVISELSFPDFSDLPATHYFMPETIFSIQASRNCYWRKCSFCTHHFGSRYAIKSVDRMIAELRSLQDGQHARFFHFVDEAMSPAYLERLSQAILEAGLELRFYCYGRLERAFTRELFELAYRAGLRMVLWGFESANERVYRLMRKGDPAHPDERLRILEAAYAAGVWNFLFVMFGFPTETLEEAKETVDFLSVNRRILSHSTGSSFMLLDNAPMLSRPQDFGISDVRRTRNGFSFAHQFTAAAGMTAADKRALAAYKADKWRLDSMKYRDSSFREKLFMYVCRFGVTRVSQLREEIWL